MHTTRNTQQQTVMARIMRNATMHQKNFTIKEHGSWKQAEAAAQNWLTNIKATLPEPRMNEMNRMTSRNSSGVVGVWLSKTIRKMQNGNKHVYWAWKAKWPECERSGGVSFPISENLSDNDAFVLAVLARQHQSIDRNFLKQQLVKIYGSNSHYEILQSKNAAPKLSKAFLIKSLKV